MLLSGPNVGRYIINHIPPNRLRHHRMLTEPSLCSWRKVKTGCFVYDSHACAVQRLASSSPSHLFRHGHARKLLTLTKKLEPQRLVTVNCLLGRDVRDGGFGKAGVTQRGQGTPEGPRARCSSSASEREVCSTLRAVPCSWTGGDRGQSRATKAWSKLNSVSKTCPDAAFLRGKKNRAEPVSMKLAESRHPINSQIPTLMVHAFPMVGSRDLEHKTKLQQLLLLH